MRDARRTDMEEYVAKHSAFDAAYTLAQVLEDMGFSTSAEMAHHLADQVSIDDGFSAHLRPTETKYVTERAGPDGKWTEVGYAWDAATSARIIRHHIQREPAFHWRVRTEQVGGNE